MVREQYQQDLKNLRLEFYEMLIFTFEAFKEAMSALKSKDIKQAKEMKDLNKKFFDWEQEIEQKCFRVIASQSPVAVDLRMIFGIIQSITDVKRILATTLRIAKVVRRYVGEFNPDYKITSSIHQMGDILTDMYGLVIEVLKNEHDKLDKAQVKALQEKLISRDDKVDIIFKESMNRLIDIIDQKDHDRENAKQIVDSILIVRHLERLGDHVNNVAEKVIYIETGKRYSIH